ncbi:hypothetical protein GCM10009541_30320 [Micromonospora gifhornensis]
MAAALATRNHRARAGVGMTIGDTLREGRTFLVPYAPVEVIDVICITYIAVVRHRVLARRAARIPCVR